jgi:osmoprotectant transport system ATP-binding protein
MARLSTSAGVANANADAADTADTAGTRTNGASIEFVGVSKTFGVDQPPAVGSLDLRIDGGELVTFVGPSGCGKTTILRMINRMLTPSSGQIFVDGIDTATLPVDQLRRDIGYVIQQVGLFPHRTVADNIATVPRLLGWDRDRIRRRVTDLAELMSIDSALLDRYPASLSGGQQQRVGVARAMAANPPLMLMDEPYSAVDPIVRAHLQRELLALHRELPTTIVFVTHDIDEATLLGDRVAVFEVGGRLAQYDPPATLLHSPADDSVPRCLGADRELRRLALRTVGSLALRPLEPSDERLGVSVEADTNARSAVDAMIAARTDRAIVTKDGRPIGCIEFSELTVASAGIPPLARGHAE